MALIFFNIQHNAFLPQRFHDVEHKNNDADSTDIYHFFNNIRQI